MMRPTLRNWLLCGAAAACLLPTPDVLAWGDEGHRIVAVIAYARLTPAARMRADAILAADDDPLTPPDFVSRATWADKYRESDRKTTRLRYEATRNWHFSDIEIDDNDLAAACPAPPLAPGVLASQGPAEDCVLHKIEQFAAELAAPATSPDERLLALKFLLHFVGDMHQPLHSADHHDRGGNSVPVLWGDLTLPSNLHAYWDTRLVEMLGLDPMQIGTDLNKRITRRQARQWAAGTPESWVRETFLKAKSVTYDFSGETVFTDPQGVQGERLDAVYDARALPVVREQLSKAGVRLAVVLNKALKQP